MNRLGLGYEALREIHPGLIYCGISGFVRTEPHSNLGDINLIVQGMSGLMSVTGNGPGHPPLKTRAPICNVMTGMFGAMGVLTALHHRNRTGEGQFVDTSLFEPGIAASFHQPSQYVASGEAPVARGNVHPLNGPYEVFQAKDGWMTVATGNDERWSSLVHMLGHAELIADPRYAKTPEHMADLDGVHDILTPILTPYFQDKIAPNGCL
jgi:crotonobetainyl-CoA:carnitine CoA-transferase CaiB-like acyl-CoA transferase